MSIKCHKIYPEHREEMGDEEGSKRTANETQVVARILKYKWMKVSCISEKTGASKSC